MKVPRARRNLPRFRMSATGGLSQLLAFSPRLISNRVYREGQQGPSPIVRLQIGGRRAGPMTSKLKDYQSTKNSTCAPAAVVAIPKSKGGDNRDNEEYQCRVEHIILHRRPPRCAASPIYNRSSPAGSPRSRKMQPYGRGATRTGSIRRPGVRSRPPPARRSTFGTTARASTTPKAACDDRG